MSINKKGYIAFVSLAKIDVTGFSAAYTIDQSSKRLITNYSRNIVAIALHFNRVPHEISVEEINSYLYRILFMKNYPSAILNIQFMD